ncbi:MAG: alpha/beta hydrolase [Saprospiraceae bacterium]|nr:alpha/beta hydrolase [Saprospiraceae bacterium]
MEKQESIVLLHGAIGDHHQMLPLATLLSERYQVFTPDFPGHGRDTALCQLDVDYLVDFLKDYLGSHTNGPVLIFGFSMGGFVATLCAARYPNLIKGIITYGTKWQWSPDIAENEVSMLDVEKISEKLPAFANKLDALHSGIGWKNVLLATKNLMQHLGQNNESLRLEMASVSSPILIIRGSHDKMVSREESIAMENLLSRGEYSEISEFIHNIEQLDPILLLAEIKKHDLLV